MLGFFLSLIAFAVAAFYTYKYVTSASRLLERLRTDAPQRWTALGRPEKVNMGRGNTTISPLWPFLTWVWGGQDSYVPNSVRRELEPTSQLLRRALVAFLGTVALFLAVFWFQGSSQSPSYAVENPYVGNMNDRSYSGQVTPEKTVSRITATGSQVSVADFSGRYVWAEYAAPWCSPCGPQARVIRELDASLGDEVVFLTIMTNRSADYNDIPTQQTAQDWASRFELNPERVLVATNLWSWRVPQHILYSPEGQTLYRATGSHSEDQIRNTSETGADGRGTAALRPGCGLTRPRVQTGRGPSGISS